ncbi:MAG: type II toxin-antitoxin system prevent-host-death family antitoxin [bacterium]|nr:type II toxin-antitoxin system prevent-host-death family antitoxin [bacterium]
MKNIVGLKELRENTEKYISEIGKGKSFVVVRRSRPIFQLVPVEEFGDEGVWETILDLTKGKDAEMTAGELLRRMKKTNAR